MTNHIHGQSEQPLPFQMSSAAPQPAPTAPRTPLHLTPEQVRFYDENGYLVLRNFASAEQVAALRAASEGWMEAGQQAGPAGAGSDYNFAKRAVGEVLYRVNYVHSKTSEGPNASLAFLGSPEVLSVAESLCGPDFVPTYESLVFKQEGDGEQIPWHQDAVHPRRWRIFNLGLYLDASTIGAGALRVVPGSQRQILDVCTIREQFGWDAPEVIQVEMQPGDALLHDVMVLHGSEATSGNALRRTLYFEFRAAEQIAHEGPWDSEWVERRMRLIPLALEAAEQAHPEAVPFDWQPDEALRPTRLADAQEELKVAHSVHTPGMWCSAGDAMKFTKGADS
ncbi:phytanoyl-CoA dioxygenase family protein [Deinococcus sp. KNUC1210]|uniref:phytanoyl-CoA dioxygenase family protein n=1 Tax=Deinococcus sp. KNUC1210 TaxID=2917691 RepID=UPI001EF0EFE5|nr:phytanoyl-CoA dioxygenase family protein [Deinococcus sp. KNUC1210]ULH15614.1 phytanoyl-CoA dioxygenase family protein [Deinococcus sp. KNUC1210]